MKNKKITTKRKYENKAIAYSEIFILVLATIAFSWMIGGNIKEVSAVGEVCGGGGSCNIGCGGTIYPEGNLMCGEGEVCCVPGDISNGGGGSDIVKEIGKDLLDVGKYKLVNEATKKGFGKKIKDFVKNIFKKKPTTGTDKLTLGDWIGPFHKSTSPRCSSMKRTNPVP